MATATEKEVREITIKGARAVWRERIVDEDDLVKIIRICQSEILARNKVNLVVVVGNPEAEVAITERGWS